MTGRRRVNPSRVTYGLYASSHLPLPPESPDLSKGETSASSIDAKNKKKKEKEKEGNDGGNANLFGDGEHPTSVKSLLKHFQEDSFAEYIFVA